MPSVPGLSGKSNGNYVINPYFIDNVEHATGSGRSGRVTAGMFGWIHTSGLGELTDDGPDRFPGEEYRDILEEVLLLSVRALLYSEPEPFLFSKITAPSTPAGLLSRALLNSRNNSVDTPTQKKSI